MKTICRCIIAFLAGCIVNQEFEKRPLQLYVDEKLIAEGTSNYVQVGRSQSKQYSSIDCYAAISR